MDDDSYWSRLLDRIERGEVVPVIGSRLLVAPDDGQSLYRRVAARLLEKHQVKLAPGTDLELFRELNEAVARVVEKLEDKDDIDFLYRDVHAALPELGEITPTALQQLADIEAFPLVVTLTPDSLFAKAVTDQGRALHEVVHSPQLATSGFKDLPATWDGTSPDDVHLLYLFGKASKARLYAIHDEDVLEYAHNVIAGGSNVPKNFLATLRERNLLFIGCNFPDWLSRFFLRATRSGPLAEANNKRKAWLVDRIEGSDPFIGFLGKYSPKTSVLTHVDPVAFVAELHRRWREAHPAPARNTNASAASATATPAVAAAPGPTRDDSLADTPAVVRSAGPQPGGTAPRRDGARPTPERSQPTQATFFISYSRDPDLPHALALKQVLEQLGAKDEEIFFDKQDLEPGDDYERRIIEGIHGCRYFLPILSVQTTSREEGFVFREWGEATKRLAGMNRPFIVPLVVDMDYDPEAYQQSAVQTWRDKPIDFGHAPAGTPDGRTHATLKRLLREARSAGSR